MAGILDPRVRSSILLSSKEQRCAPLYRDTYLRIPATSRCMDRRCRISSGLSSALTQSMTLLSFAPCGRCGLPRSDGHPSHAGSSALIVLRVTE